MKTTMQSILLTVSTLILVVSIIIGGLLIVSPSNSGFFPDMGFTLGVLALGAGNSLSFFINTVCWGCGFRPRWFGVLLLVQAPPALLATGGAANELWDGRMNQRAYAQLSAIEDAISNDDLATLIKARSACSERCQSMTNPDNDLLVAARSGSRTVAKHLIDHGAKVNIESWYRVSRNLNTCEGSYLPNLTPLSIAVARRDMDMVRLLLPVSDHDARTEALQTAAELDRLEFVTFLFSNGVPLRNPVPNRRDDHLLSAAAGGAAVHVGEWLLVEQPAVIEDADVQKAAEALFNFMQDVHVARSLDFARMLKANGADFNASLFGEPSFLDEAIRTKRKDIARDLLALNVDTSRLSPERAAALSELLKEPDRPIYDQRTDGCVETGG